MGVDDTLERGRDAWARRGWREAFTLLTSADAEARLEAPDLERLALAADLLAEHAASDDLWARAHAAYLPAGDPARAARCAFWLGMSLMQRGDHAQGGGWFSRAHRALDEAGGEHVERGYLLVPVALQRMGEGDVVGARSAFDEVEAIARRFGDTDLITLASLGLGQTMIATGEVARGVASLDEALLAVTAGEASPIVTGIVYCAAIVAFHDLFDLQRAQEWTEALDRWCASQPDLVPFRGQCLVHRAQVMQFHGSWRDAMAETQRARERLSDPAGQPAVGMALHQQGELHRLRGEFELAEDAYRQANDWGHVPQPGLALLRLAQGNITAAAASIRLALEEARDRLARCTVLPAFVEISLAAGEIGAARTTAEELARIAADLGAAFADAVAAHATASVLLAEGDANGALREARRAVAIWRELDTPYERARSSVIVALACRELGDHDTAAMELDAARQVFERLGAAPGVASVERLATPPSARPAGLTGREVEVLGLVASGRSNRDIAEKLVISDKTVARHVSNIFVKLGVSSRSAATAYAFRHDLV